MDAVDSLGVETDIDRFSVMTVGQVKQELNILNAPKVDRTVYNNPEARKQAQSIAKQIHKILIEYNVSANSFLNLIKEIIKSEDPNA